MVLLKLMLGSGKGKNFVTKWIKDKLYLKFGARVNIDISEISVQETDGEVFLKLNIDADCSSEDFYDILEKLAK